MTSPDSTRLLSQEAFGVMAIVNTMLTGLNLFSDIGIGPSVVQNPRGNEPSFLNTAWCLQILRGLVLFGICAAGATLVADFYD